MRHFIALLLTAALCGCGGDGRDEAKDAAIREMFQSYEKAMNLYHDQYMQYPDGDAQTMLEELDREGFLSGVDTSQVDKNGWPLDEYGHRIMLDADKKRYTLKSPGANGQFGDDDDIIQRSE
ncbi:MAG: hypothetical protein R3236_01130 [Phycisphaeraceae bacterium]|nr:hypothetical protein [Phycisphaeraceae bacterium]